MNDLKHHNFDLKDDEELNASPLFSKCPSKVFYPNQQQTKVSQQDAESIEKPIIKGPLRRNHELKSSIHQFNQELNKVVTMAQHSGGHCEFSDLLSTLGLFQGTKGKRTGSQ